MARLTRARYAKAQLVPRRRPLPVKAGQCRAFPMLRRSATIKKKWGYKCHCIPTRYFPGRKWLRSIILRCPIPICHIAVSFSADHVAHVFVMLSLSWCVVAKLIHVSVYDKADGIFGSPSFLMSAVKSRTVKPSVTKTLVRNIVIISSSKQPSCS